MSPPGNGASGLVFQNYALFRHMTVGENIEFALKVRRMKSAERRERRKELLRLVALEGMDDRLPTQLSGGQQQRVASRPPHPAITSATTSAAAAFIPRSAHRKLPFPARHV